MSKQVNSICVKFVYPVAKTAYCCYNMPTTHGFQRVVVELLLLAMYVMPTRCHIPLVYI